MFSPFKMKILTWNCNGALRRKFELLEPFQADIIIVQECENPADANDKGYINWAANYLWTGENKNKGLGIFAGEGIRIRKLAWNSYGLQYFIPCKINDDFTLLGLWCHGANSADFQYIGQLWRYLQKHKNKLNKSIIAGDFNSNVIWDRKRRCWNHSDVVRELKEIKIESLYHRHFVGEEQGKELQPTFYLHKNPTKPYHIDYIFSSEDFIKSFKHISIGASDKWLNKSDHMPVCCEV